MSKPFYVVERDVLVKDDIDWLYAWSMGNMYRAESNQDPMYDGKVLHFEQVQNPKIRTIMFKVLDKMREMLVANFDDTDNVQIESIMINRWDCGDALSLHADNAYYCPDVPEKHLKPNISPWRTHSAVFYMNDEFIGGDLYFLGGHDIHPEKNSIVMFSGKLDTPHGVRVVEGGQRWTMPVWFTNDPKHYRFDEHGRDLTNATITHNLDPNTPVYEHMKQLTG